MHTISWSLGARSVRWARSKYFETGSTRPSLHPMPAFSSIHHGHASTTSVDLLIVTALGMSNEALLNDKLFLTVHDQPIYFQPDWDTGIGGGLWSTGLAMAQYLQKIHPPPHRVLELGSGNGLLAVCWKASSPSSTVLATDLADHLPLMQKTADANPHLPIHVHEYAWGGNPPTSFDSIDIVVGSDVAYREHLYEPLIDSLELIQPRLALLGVTMNDTKPRFFDLLRQRGFVYEKLDDSLLEPEFRGTTFGIFVVQRRQK